MRYEKRYPCDVEGRAIKFIVKRVMINKISNMQRKRVIRVRVRKMNIYVLNENKINRCQTYHTPTSHFYSVK